MREWQIEGEHDLRVQRDQAEERRQVASKATGSEATQAVEEAAAHLPDHPRHLAPLRHILDHPLHQAHHPRTHRNRHCCLSFQRTEMQQKRDT